MHKTTSAIALMAAIILAVLSLAKPVIVSQERTHVPNDYPLSIWLLIDNSGSMGNFGQTRFKSAAMIAQDMALSVLKTVEVAKLGIRIGVLHFGDTALLTSLASNDYADVRRRIVVDKPCPPQCAVLPFYLRGTNFYSALKKTFTELAALERYFFRMEGNNTGIDNSKAKLPRRDVVVVLTDGNDPEFGADQREELKHDWQSTAHERAFVLAEINPVATSTIRDFCTAVGGICLRGSADAMVEQIQQRIAAYIPQQEESQLTDTVYVRDYVWQRLAATSASIAFMVWLAHAILFGLLDKFVKSTEEIHHDHFTKVG